jgi:error-prone DNA polymerase
VLLQGQLLSIKGTVEREGEVIHVVAGHVIDRTDLLGTLADHAAADAVFASRDFH